MFKQRISLLRKLIAIYFANLNNFNFFVILTFFNITVSVTKIFVYIHTYTNTTVSLYAAYMHTYINNISHICIFLSCSWCVEAIHTPKLRHCGDCWRISLNLSVSRSVVASFALHSFRSVDGSSVYKFEYFCLLFPRNSNARTLP